MSLRTFVDSAGIEWEAFDVVPRAHERRNYDRRHDEKIDDTPDDRRDSDRRLTVGGSGEISGAQGWLCFERGGERRRLSPIPDDWGRATDAQLEIYCKAARPVRRLRAARAQPEPKPDNENAAVNPRR